ncbi:MAG TPA: sulfate transporter [Chloroflexi bacterium]|nr:sulfate transporter [Chloroflexota bacterium]
MLANLKAIPFYFLRPVEVFRSYQLSDLRPDLVAGITVAVISLPQAIAYALVAGLPPQMGLYAAIVAPIVAALWGSSRQLQTTPTTALSLLVFASLSATAPPGTPQIVVAAGLLAVLAGIVQVAMGLARLGVLVNFVSDAVIVGFAAGAGVQIATSELRHLFGLSFPSGTLIETIGNLVAHLPQTNLPTLALGLGTLLLMVLLQRLKPELPAMVISLVVASAVLVVLGLSHAGVKVIGRLPSSLPPVARLPLFNLNLIADLAPGALAIAALALIQAIAIARSLAAQTGERLESNQEFVGQGLANIACGFLSGYPTGGSLSCSAINYEAGAQTALASVFSGLFTLVGMLTLAPLGVFLPRAALSGVLIVVGLSMIKQRQMMHILRSSPGDGLIMVVTFVGTLFLRIDFAVLAGISMSLGYYILKTSAPRVLPVVPDDNFRHLAHQPRKPGCPQLAIFDVLGDLYFGAVNHVEETIRRHQASHPGQRFLLLRMHSVQHCDISGVHMLEGILRSYRERGGDLFLTRVRAPVLRLMKATGFYDTLGADHFLNEDEAIEYLFYKVLDPAICIYESDVRVFRECQNLPRPDHAVEILVPTDIPIRGVPDVSPRDLWQQLHSDRPPRVIDVREPREFKQGHIPHAQLVPLPTLLSEKLELARDGTVVFVCRGGRRSTRAAAIARDQGYENVAVLQGGMLAWEAAGLLKAIDYDGN